MNLSTHEGLLLPQHRLSAEMQEKIAECSRRGISKAQAARELGIHRDTVIRYWPHQFHEPKIAPNSEPPQALEEMKQAASRAGVLSAYSEDDEEPLDQVWKRAEVDSARRIRKAHEQSTFRWRAPGPHVLIAAISDQHIAPGTPVDFRAMREDAELVRSTPNCFAVLGGDGVDNHIKHQAAILAARSQPDDQFKLFEYYLQIFGDRILAMIGGNHEAWTVARAGVDILARIAKDNRICYSPDEAWLEITVGSQTYNVAVRHQFRMNSSFNQTHSVKQWLRLGPREFDLGIIGHHHEHAVESHVYRGREVWVCRPGSYQVTSAYSRQYGFNSSIPSTPTFLLRGDQRCIMGFSTLRTALSYLGAAREMGVAA